jgi:hypothetical protein
MENQDKPIVGIRGFAPPLPLKKAGDMQLLAEPRQASQRSARTGEVLLTDRQAMQRPSSAKRAPEDRHAPQRPNSARRAHSVQRGPDREFVAQRPQPLTIPGPEEGSRAPTPSSASSVTSAFASAGSALLALPSPVRSQCAEVRQPP